MTKLLKKIESLESKVKALSEKWDGMKEENARLLHENRSLQDKLLKLQQELKVITGERSEEDKASAIKPGIKQAIDDCITEMEEGLDLLRQYKNGI